MVGKKQKNKQKTERKNKMKTTKQQTTNKQKYTDNPTIENKKTFELDQIKQQKEMLIRELSIANNRLDLIRNSIYNIYSAIETIDTIDILKLQVSPITEEAKIITDNLDILVKDIINILPKKGKNEKK